ncbi:hypothetical protein Tco_0833810 [Tanacetum coccineum]
MLNIFELMDQKVNEKSPKENIFQNEIDRLLEVSLTREIRDCVLISVEEQKNEMLRKELEKSSSDSKDIQAKLLKRIKILENDSKRSQAQRIDFALKLQHQKEKIPCNVSWKSRLSTLNDDNVSKPVTSQSIPKKQQSQKQSVNVIARGIYRITKTKTQTSESKTNMNVSNSMGVESSNSVRRPKSKNTKSKDRVLKNTNDKRPSTHVRKMSSSVSIDSNKRETMNLTVCQTNVSVLNTKTIIVFNDGLNIVCVSCGKDVFLLSHEKCVAHYAFSRNSSIKRALFTTSIAARSKNLRATSVVAKSRINVAKTPTATNKV